MLFVQREKTDLCWSLYLMRYYLLLPASAGSRARKPASGNLFHLGNSHPGTRREDDQHHAILPSPSESRLCQSTLELGRLNIAGEISESGWTRRELCGTHELRAAMRQRFLLCAAHYTQNWNKLMWLTTGVWSWKLVSHWLVSHDVLCEIEEEASWRVRLCRAWVICIFWSWRREDGCCVLHDARTGGMVLLCQPEHREA